MRASEFYHDANYYYIVCELLEGGDLQELEFNELQTAKIIYQILKGIQFLHENNIVHRDLKPANVMVEQKDTLDIKIVDFGFSKVFLPNKKLCKYCGSLLYNAPELLEENLQYDEKVDIWAIGVIAYNMLFDYAFPFMGATEFEVMEKIKVGKFTVDTDKNVSNEAIDFLIKTF